MHVDPEARALEWEEDEFDSNVSVSHSETKDRSRGITPHRASSEMAFKIAGSMAFKDGVKKCNPVLLEPMMKVEVESPEDFLGSVIGDLSSRRGQVEGQSVDDGLSKVQAKVPLAEMFGYATQLRSMTQGRGIFCLLYTSPSPRDAHGSRMPSSA